MNYISMAFMAVFAFSGANTAPVQAPATAPATALVATTTAIALADAPEFVRATGADATTFTVKVTSYNAVPEQTDSNPSVTASGAASNSEVVAARSIDLKGDLPFGTVVALEYAGKDSETCRFGAVSRLIGYRVIADSMHERKRNQVDVLLNPEDTVMVHGQETNPSIALGVCDNVTVRVIGSLKLKDMPQTQEQLRKLVDGNTLAVAR